MYPIYLRCFKKENMEDTLTLSTSGFIDHFLESYGSVEEFKYNSGFFYKKYITKDDIFFEPKLSFLYTKEKRKIGKEDYFGSVKDFRPFCDSNITNDSTGASIHKIVRMEVRRQIKKIRKGRKEKRLARMNSKKG